MDAAEIYQLADSMAANTEVLRSQLAYMEDGEAKDACLHAVDWATRLASEVQALADGDPAALTKDRTNRMIADWREICAEMGRVVESGKEGQGNPGNA